MTDFLNRRVASTRRTFCLASLAALTAPVIPVRFAPRRPADQVLALAARLRAATYADAFDVAGQAIRAGAASGQVLSAILLAGVEEIRPRPHGILHTVMMVESAQQLSDAAVGGRAAWHPVFFNLHDFKEAQAEDRAEWDDFQMQPLRADASLSRDAARREFMQAWEERDADRAERAIVALHRHLNVESCFDLLRPLAARCYAFLGHKLIYAVQLEQSLRRIRWKHSESALRSLVRTLLVEHDQAAYDETRESTHKVPTWLLNDQTDPARIEALATSLLKASRTTAPRLVVGALEAGLVVDGVWDAILLAGSRIFHLRPGRRAADGRNALLPVHAFTVPSAFRTAFSAARSQLERNLYLLQAAAWVAALNADLQRIVGLSLDAPALAAERSDDAESLDAVLASGLPARALAFLQRGPQQTTAFAASLRSALARRGREHHQHKYAAAVQLEASRMQHALRPLLLAPALDYLANPADGPTDVHARAEHALERAGID